MTVELIIVITSFLSVLLIEKSYKHEAQQHSDIFRQRFKIESAKNFIKNKGTLKCDKGHS